MRIVEGAEVRLASGRGSTVVCLPLGDTQDVEELVDRVLASIGSVIEYTQPQPQIVIAGELQTLQHLAEQGDRHIPDGVIALPLPGGKQDGALLDLLIDACAPADLVLLAPGVRVHPHWLARLGAAALADTVTASATAMFDGDHDAAEAIAQAGPALRPRIECIGPHCALIRRQALDLIGPLETAESYAQALRLLSLRLRGLGFLHVAADDLAVRLPHDEPAGPQSETAALGELDELDAMAVRADLGPLPRTLRRGGAAQRALRVTIDGRSLTAAVGGTQTYVLSLALALAQEPRLKLRALIAPDVSEQASAMLRDAGVEMITPQQAQEADLRDDVVHRAQQISSPEDFAILKAVGERLVITHQDLIAYHNPLYHRDQQTWARHRETTAAALAAADQVVFFSEHARQDALSEDLLPAERAHVVGIGAPPPLAMPTGQSAPDGLAATDRFLFCLGADYAHKNRPFAIRLLSELNALGWEGKLVLAGPHVPHGSSREQEQLLLHANPALRERVMDLGRVEEQTKRWLFANACALVYPSIYEGFGLLPLEAAAADLPCLYAPAASLAELDAGAATLTPWDAAASAAAVLPLLSDGPPRDRHLRTLAKLRVPSWPDVVQRLLEVYELAALGPRSAGALLDPQAYLELVRQLRHTTQELDYHRDLAQNYQDALHALEARVSFGLPLIDDGGLLSHDQQRGLMRIASRPPIRAVALGPFSLLGRLSSSSQDDSGRQGVR